MPPLGSPPHLDSISRSLTLRSLYPFVLRAFADIDPARRSSMRVLDIPAGGGILSVPLAAAGFQVTPADLFPETLTDTLKRHEGCTVLEFFKREADGVDLPAPIAAALLGDRAASLKPQDPSLSPVAADMEARLPFESATFDIVLCVEGIEHVKNRHEMLDEFRRVLKPGGRLILTTPNLLSLRARLAYALAGQRAFKSYVDEYTSVWGRSADGSRTYHGHAFLVNYFQVRYSLHHCGFRIRRLLRSNWSLSSIALLPLVPLVWLATTVSQRRAVKKFERLKREGCVPADAEVPYAEMMRHLLSPEILLNSTLIVEAEAR